MKKRTLNQVFGRPWKEGECAVLVCLDFGAEDFEYDCAEFRELAVSAGAEIAAFITGTRHKPDSKYFVGSGKAQAIREAVEAHQAVLVILNHSLSPAQGRNLERFLNCRVIDRTDLILDIFAKRARSFEGKLQVELAQLKHLATRLVRGWTHLERQRGGIGLRGPGETQLETDKRLLGNRIKVINRKLAKVSSQRQLSRRARQRACIPTISLVGYTNAGKSTLFNRITTADVYAADQLFATLDPTLRKLHLREVGEIILADTVGFIRKLPHDLVVAFHATLEETAQADLLLHVIDAADPNRRESIEAVESVLADIGAANIPRLQVYNKIDLMSGHEPHIDYDIDRKPTRLWVSAMTGAGLDLVVEALTKSLNNKVIECDLQLTSQEAAIRSQLYQMGAVLSETQTNEGGWRLQIKLPYHHYQRLLKHR